MGRSFGHGALDIAFAQAGSTFLEIDPGSRVDFGRFGEKAARGVKGAKGQKLIGLGAQFGDARVVRLQAAQV